MWIRSNRIVAVGAAAAFPLLALAAAQARAVAPSPGAQDDGASPSAVEVVIPAKPAVPEGDDTTSASIGAKELEGHVRALSHDSLEGRPMGSDASLVAAKYCADRMAALGAKPGFGDSYYQPIELASVTYDEVPELVVTAKDGSTAKLKYGEGFSFRSAAAVLDTGALRCVLIAEEEEVPAEADPSIALVFQTSAGKATRWLREAGHPRGAGFGLVVVPRRNAKPGKVSTPRAAPMRPVQSQKGTTSVTMVGPWGDRAYAGELATVDLRPRATVTKKLDVNVIGVIPGVGTKEHPELKDEIVVLSGHRDHVGILRVREGAEIPEDVIRNGADDDASGCAAILEIAEAIAAGEAPARTLVVMLVTGEEVGFVGSSYWVAHPTVPIERVVCALNFEMLGRPDELAGGAGKIWLTGDERSDLGPTLRSRGVEVSADVRPEMNFFARSDNVPFAKAGIVAQTLSSYGGHRDYHQPSDEWDTLDYAHMETAVGACLKATLLLANTPDWKPAWNEGEPKF